MSTPPSPAAPDGQTRPAGQPPLGAPRGAVHGAAVTDRAVHGAAVTDRPAPAGPDKRPETAKPEGLPDKFWDAARNQVRLEALIRSYRELERRLSAGDGPDRAPAAVGVPDSPDAYRIETDPTLVRADPEVNAILHAEGFTERQVQLVYDLAAEVLSPIARSFAMQAAGAGHRARLEAHFGGPERWAEVRRQLKRWAEGKLPEDAYKALVSSYEGVLALHRMMERKEEPAPLADGAAPTALSEEQLRRKMRDPRYWRDRDPRLLREVTDGFKRLYPDG
eukprot:g11602.t1